MVARFTMRTYGVNQSLQLVEGNWLHRKSSQNRGKNRKRPILIVRAQHVLGFHLVYSVLQSAEDEAGLKFQHTRPKGIIEEQSQNLFLIEYCIAMKSCPIFQVNLL